MSVKNIPWAVTGNASTLHSSGLVRNATHVFGNGRQGVAGDGLKVVASSTPNSNVIVKFGNAVIHNSKVLDEHQAYVVALKGDTVVSVPNNQTSSSVKMDFIILEVLDPEYDTSLTMTDSHVFTRLRSVSYMELNELMTARHPVLPLAQIMWQGNATRITESMITDIREFTDNNGVRFFQPTLQNGWRTYNNKSPKYYKTADNVVYLTGVIANSSSGTSWRTVLILPEGYRPKHTLDFAVLCAKSRTKIINHLSIQPTGEVAVEQENVDYMSLDGVNFLV